MASYDNLNSASARNSPYGEPHYADSTGFITPQQPVGRKRGVSNWVKFGIPVAILVIIGAVLGGVLGTRHHSNDASTSSSSASASAAASSAASAKGQLGLFATATDSFYMKPLYPSTTNAAAFSTPTYLGSADAAEAWPTDSFSPAKPAATSVRSDRPRLIAPAYKWNALPALIPKDAYLTYWNQTIFENASIYYNLPVVVYFLDGDSGILDNCRDIKQRIKAFAYVYRMTNDTKWADRAYLELQNAVSDSFGPSGSTKWNPGHFLDTAEMSAAWGLAYDWMYDAWTATQKTFILSNLINYGLSNGVEVYTGDPHGYGWWTNNIEGNWNCVCNSGLTMASLAILGDDTSGTATQLLGDTINNAKINCALAVSSDGTWSETANYWYFGTTAHAEMSASLLSATGSDYGLLHVNPTFNETGDYHMYVSGSVSLFNYGDTGPNKYSTTANSMIFYASHFDLPRFALFQRDQADAAEPWSMFWYDPTISGAFWDNMPLDRYFTNTTDQWVSIRSSWTDIDALYVAMKAGTLQGHQTHNDLDAGDFVIDALGTRWAGELGSGDYRSTGYFSSDAQDSQRWLYYRKRTEGQNCILIDEGNQDVTAAPTVEYGSTGEAQGSSTVYSVPGTSTAYFTSDLTSAYFNTTSYSRGIRTINGRKQVLLQDEINTSGTIMWRMHTNATIAISSNNGTNNTATLTIDDQTMVVQILGPSSASFTTMEAVALPSDPPTPTGYPNQDNPGVTVLVIELPAGTYDLQVLFNPQWSGMSASDYKTPSFVALSSWSTTSHP